MARKARDLDTVELRHDVAGWPAGAVGTVVSEYADTALVEMGTEHRVDARGLPERDLFDDLVSAPYSALHVIEPAATLVR